MSDAEKSEGDIEGAKSGEILEGLGATLIKGKPDEKEIPEKDKEKEIEDPPADDKKPEADPPAEDKSDDKDEIIIPDDILPEEEPIKKEEGEAEEDELPEDGDKAKQAWIHTRTQLKEARAKITELEARDPATADPEEVTQLKTDLKEALDTISRVSLERHPDFIKKYQGQRNILTTQIKGMLKELGLEEDIADTAANKTIKDRLLYINEQAPDIAAPLGSLFTQLDTLEVQRKAELENHKTALTELEANMQESESAELVKLRTQHFASALEALQGEGHILFMKSKSNEEYNAGVDKLINASRAIFETDDLDLQAKTLLAGVEAPIYLKMFRSERAARQKLEKEIGILNKGKPRINSTSRTTDKSGKKEIPDRMSAKDIATRVTANIGAE